MRFIAICVPKKGFNKWFDASSKSAAEKRAIKELTKKNSRLAGCKLATQRKPKNNIAQPLKWFKNISRKQALKKVGK